MPLDQIPRDNVSPSVWAWFMPGTVGHKVLLALVVIASCALMLAMIFGWMESAFPNLGCDC